MLRQALQQWFWDMYDHLGRLLVANVALCIVLLPAAWILMGAALAVTQPMGATVQVLALFLLVVLAGPVWLTLWFAPVLHFAALASAEKDPGLREFLRGLRAAGPRAWRLFQPACLIAALLLINMWFYIASSDFPGQFRWLGYALAGLCFWLLLMLAACLLTAAPVIVRGDAGVRGALKAGLVKLLKYPALVGGALLFLAFLWVLGAWLKFSGIILFGFTGTAMLMNSVLDVVREREASEREAALRDGAPPTSWTQIRAGEEAGEEQRQRRARYGRSLRDLLRPWES